MKILQLLLCFCFSCVLAFSQPAPAAKNIMNTAFKKAAKENKNVFVKLSASWCGWCHKMDASMKDSSCKKFFDDNFVTVQLVVDEANDKKGLENPGADDYRIKYNGDKNQGIPFWFILDSKGNLLGDCYIRKEGQSLLEKGRNTGCPANAEEVASFIKLLKQTTDLTDDELQIISDRFRKNEIKRD